MHIILSESIWYVYLRYSHIIILGLVIGLLGIVTQFLSHTKLFQELEHFVELLFFLYNYRNIQSTHILIFFFILSNECAVTRIQWEEVQLSSIVQIVIQMEKVNYQFMFFLNCIRNPWFWFTHSRNFGKHWYSAISTG